MLRMAAGAKSFVASKVDEGSTAHERILDVRERKNGRAAHLGTATHKSYEYILRTKLGLDTTGASSAEEAAEQSLVTGFDETEDNTATKIGDIDNARKYLERMVVVAVEIANLHKPVSTEGEVAYSAGGIDWVGHYDGFLEDGELPDLKTHSGKPKWYGSQFGGYSLGLKAQGADVTSLRQYNISRVKEKAANLEVVEYQIAPQETLARNTMLKFANNLESFAATGDPLKFTANPADPLCSPKYCPAWGTKMCPVGRGAPNNNGT